MFPVAMGRVLFLRITASGSRPGGAYVHVGTVERSAHGMEPNVNTKV